jgi:hypothetical protein
MSYLAGAPHAQACQALSAQDATFDEQFPQTLSTVGFFQ